MVLRIVKGNLQVLKERERNLQMFNQDVYEQMNNSKMFIAKKEN